MEEEENNKEKEEEENPIDEAKEVLANLEKQNKIMSENLDRQERLKATDMLGGKSETTEKQTEDQKITEGAKKLLEGSGFEDLLDEKK